MLPFDIDIQLNHLIEGALAARGVKDHRQRFPPGPQPQPVEVVDGLSKGNALGQ